MLSSNFDADQKGKSYDDLVCTQGCADGGRGGVAPPILSNLQECWSKVSQAARGLTTVFSVTFLL